MSLEARFTAYAQAFEDCYADDDWSRLKDYFTADATYDGGVGDPARGVDDIVEKLQKAVNGLDRLMDSRSLEFAPLVTHGDTVSTQWTATYHKAGAEPLRVVGKEFARFEGDRIAELWDEIDAESMQRFGSWMAQHGDRLSPPA